MARVEGLNEGWYDAEGQDQWSRGSDPEATEAVPALLTGFDS
ncbi:hypothetical protein [Streptomyces sp. NPDC004266]